MKFLSQINVNTEYTLPIVDGSNGQVLATDGNGTVYWGSISAGATNLDGLSDVEITSPQPGQILNYSVPLAQCQCGGTSPLRTHRLRLLRLQELQRPLQHPRLLTPRKSQLLRL